MAQLATCKRHLTANMSTYALITGGSKRIGKVIALALAEMGYDILLHYNRSVEAADETAQLIEDKGQKCRLKQADLQHDEDVQALIGGLSDDISLEILVNNASIFGKSSLKFGETDYFDTLFDVNFRAPYTLTKHFARRCRDGLILNLLDTKINRNRSEYADYWLTKKTLAAFTKLSATQLSPDIRVNGIAPGLILPPAGKDKAYLQDMAQSVPMKKVGDLNKLTKTVKFLVYNDYITGEIIHVDGGEHL